MRDIYVLYTLRRVVLFLILIAGLIAGMVWVLNISAGLIIDKDEVTEKRVEHIRYEMGRVYQWEKEGNREAVTIYQIFPGGQSKMITKENGRLAEIAYIGKMILRLEDGEVIIVSNPYDVNTPNDTTYYPAYFFWQELAEAEKEFEVIKNKFVK